MADTHPQRIKGRQVRRYYRLLVRVGLDAMFDAMSQSLTRKDVKPEEVSVEIDFGRIVRACAGADANGEGAADLSATDELAAAVLDLDDETAAAGDWFMDDLEAAWPLFIKACGAPLRMLMTSGVGSGSAMTPAAQAAETKT